MTHASGERNKQACEKCQGKRTLPLFVSDFCIDGAVWIELKGYMNTASRAKIDQFRKDYPDEILWIVGPDVYKILKQHYTAIVNWENK